MKYAIIGGTGVYSAGSSASVKPLEMKNEYGTAVLDLVEADGTEVAFLARHGANHSVPPHRINYRANIQALKDLGVEYCLATCAVGSLNENFPPGSLVVLKDYLEFTKAREATFCDGTGTKVFHTGMHDPYCQTLRRELYRTAKERGVSFAGDAVYVTVEGPRFETAAEIRFFQSIGGDIVGMTNYPEAALAKEAGIHYAAVGIITNWCVGVGGGMEVHDIQGIMDRNKKAVIDLFLSVFRTLPPEDGCSCKHSVIIL